jgi:zinc-ribbon domain
VDPARGDVLEERQPRQSVGRPSRDPEPHVLRGEVPQIRGGLTCRRCGADNKPDAAFCRQCGASLKEAVVVPVPPWWRQLLSRSKPAALKAGSRPQWRKPKRVPAGAVSLLAVTGLFAGVAYAGRDVIAASAMRAVDEVTEKPWSAQTITASDWTPGRGPELAVDGSAVRSWASSSPARPGTAYLEAGFTPAFHLTYVVITLGPASQAPGAVPERRPSKVEIVAVRSDGQRSTLTVDLNGTLPGPQYYYFGADQVSTVRLNILEATGPAEAGVSVGEVQFAGR